MAEKQPEDRPLDPSGNRDSDVAGRDDLDELLEEASSLASELSEEVGPAEPAPFSAASNPTAGSSGDPTSDLDAQLVELEELTRATGSEIGRASDVPDYSAPPEDVPPLAEESKSSIPDFMEEFTRPPEPPPEKEPEGTTAPSVTPIPGVVSSKTIGRVTGRPGSPGLEQVSVGKEAGAAEGTAASDLSQSSEGSSAAPSLIHRLMVVLSPLALSLCERCVGLLEKVNGPFRAIGEAPRRIIGWVAVATFATSLIVLLISLF